MCEQSVLEQDSRHSAACPGLAVFQYRTLHTRSWHLQMFKILYHVS